MNTAPLASAYPGVSRHVAADQWRRRVFEGGHAAGAIAVLIPAMLFAGAVTGMRPVEVAMYFVLLIAVLPCLPGFITSLHRTGSGLMLVLLFTALTVSTAAAFYLEPTVEVWLRAKALAATAVWASIYIIVFVAIRTPRDANRFIGWIDAVCLLVSASIWAGAGLHLVGVSFGEVIDQGGTFRAFGPLGDQVAFVVVLPVLTSLVARRPLLFGFHAASLLLTGTRGALVCVTIGIVGYLVVGARTRNARHRWHMLSIVAVGALVWFTPASAALRERFLSPSMRVEAIQAGIDVVRRAPVIGFGFHGLDTNRAAVAEDWTAPAQAANGLARTQNQYMQTAVDGGGVALLLLILFVFLGIRNALHVIRWPAATPQLLAAQLWLISMFIGNQGSLWLLSDTASGFFALAIAGLAAKASDLSARE